MEGKFGVKRGEQHLAALDTLIASVVMCLYVKGKITVCRLSFPQWCWNKENLIQSITQFPFTTQIDLSLGHVKTL